MAPLLTMRLAMMRILLALSSCWCLPPALAADGDPATPVPSFD